MRLIDYITEAIKGHLLPLTKSNAQEAFKIEDNLSSMLNISKEFSMNNKQDAEKFFNAFMNELIKRFGGNERAARQAMKEFGIETWKKFQAFIDMNVDKMKAQGYKVSTMKNYNLTKLQQEYQAWKKSKDYVEPKSYDDVDWSNLDTDEVRTLAVYSAKDPSDESMVGFYEFRGKLGKHNSHQLNMIKMDWAYQYGGPKSYYDARPILATTWDERKANGTLDELRSKAEFEKSIDEIGE